MKILDEVKKTVAGRQKHYSDFGDTMNLTAEIANKILNTKLSGADVSLIYAVNKLVRSRGVMKKDSILDAIAYLAIIPEIKNLK